MGKPNMGAQLGGVGVEAMQTENRGHVGLGSRADSTVTVSIRPFLAISGPKDECQKSEIFQNRLYGNFP